MSLLTSIPTINRIITITILTTRFLKNGSFVLQNSVKGGNKSDATKSKIKHDKNDLLAKAPRANNTIKIEKPVVHLGKIYFNVVKFSVKDEQIQVLYHG